MWEGLAWQHLQQVRLDEDTEFVFSGSDDDFEVDLDEEFDPLEREQGNHQSVI